MGVLDEVAAQFIGQARGRPPRHEGASYDPERVAEAARNWKRCERARKQAERSIETGGPLAAEDAVRKQKYVDRLMKKAGVVAASGREEVPQGVKDAIEASASGRLKVGTMPDKALELTVKQAVWKELETAPADITVIKNRYSALAHGSSTLERVLRNLGVDTVLVAGTKTNVCCDSTARDAMMLDFKSIMLADCCAALRGVATPGAVPALRESSTALGVPVANRVSPSRCTEMMPGP